jgi:translation initiation factor IF-1
MLRNGRISMRRKNVMKIDSTISERCRLEHMREAEGAVVGVYHWPGNILVQRDGCGKRCPGTVCEN